MAAGRTSMLFGGVVLASLSGLTGLLRLLGLLSIRDLAPEVFWAGLFACLVIGVSLVVFSPPSRHAERRVDLDRTRPDDKKLRPQRPPAGKAGLPVTRTAPAAKKEVSRTRPLIKGSPPGKGTPPPGGRRVTGGLEQPTLVGQAAGEAQETPVAPARPDGPANTPVETPALLNGHGGDGSRTNGVDPGSPDPTPAEWDRGAPVPPSMRQAQDTRGTAPAPSRAPQGQAGQAEHAPPSLRDAATGEAARASSPRDRIVPGDKAEQERALRRRAELEDRLDALEQRANSAKVSLGLGRISHAGYRQYLKEVDRERTLIESELMAIRHEL